MDSLRVLSVFLPVQTSKSCWPPGWDEPKTCARMIRAAHMGASSKQLGPYLTWVSDDLASGRFASSSLQVAYPRHALASSGPGSVYEFMAIQLRMDASLMTPR